MAWDQNTLDALRAKYGESHGGELFDPEFRKVADSIFSESGTRLAPYSGVPTFLTAPYVPVDNDKPVFGDLQVAIIGMPMDLGVTNRPGSRFGPRALRAIERIGPYHHVLGCAPVQRFAQAPDVLRASPSSVALRDAFRVEETRRQRRSDGTISVEGVRFEIPSRFRHFHSLAIRYARWDLSRMDLVDPRHGTSLAPLYPVDRAANADGER